MEVDLVDDVTSKLLLQIEFNVIVTSRHLKM